MRLALFSIFENATLSEQPERSRLKRFQWSLWAKPESKQKTSADLITHPPARQTLIKRKMLFIILKFERAKLKVSTWKFEAAFAWPAVAGDL